MGVSRLLTYARNNYTSCVEDVDLVKLASGDPNGKKLLIDFYCWEHQIRDNLDTAILKGTNNNCMRIYGGEYRILADYITSYIEALKSINIKCIFYMDGSKGSSQLTTKQKWQTWNNRQFQDLQHMKEIIGYFNRHCKAFAVATRHPRDITRPCLLEVTAIHTLQSLGCEMHPVVSGEADTYISRHMNDDSSVIGVLSDDTDFCIFPGSVLFHGDFFDLENDLDLSGFGRFVRKPTKLICGMMKAKSYCDHFGFPDHDYLYELSILVGNDFTFPLLGKRNVFRDIKASAELIKKHGCVENVHLFAAWLKQFPALSQAVQHSRAFYTMTLYDELNVPQDERMKAICAGIQSLQFPSSIYAMYRQFYWHRIIVEDIASSGVSAECALVLLRSFVYTMVLPDNLHHVMEYHTSPVKGFEGLKAWKYYGNPVPPVEKIQRFSFMRRRSIFHQIMSHQDTDLQSETCDFFQMYGNRMGFICYLLRYFLLWNWQRHLCIEKGEFLILCAWTLGSHSFEEYKEIRVRPSARCVTIENWLLLLYRMSYAFIGGLLKLVQDFPPPSELFSGLAWACLYSGCYLSPEYQNNSVVIQDFSPQQIIAINQKVTSFVKDKRHVLKKIIQDVFPFDTK